MGTSAESILTRLCHLRNRLDSMSFPSMVQHVFLGHQRLAGNMGRMYEVRKVRADGWKFHIF